jgi:bifunctional DNase/RNase
MIEVFVSRLGIDSKSDSYVVVLQERDGARVLPIWIGQPEAESIVLHMHNVKRSRPPTHDLVRNLIIALGAQLRMVQITRVEDRTYFAELHLQNDAGLINIDSRPSDGIAIALRLGAPIFAAEELLADPGTEDVADEEEDNSQDFSTGGFTLEASDDMSDAEIGAEQLKRYLEALRPEDFGKFNP